MSEQSATDHPSTDANAEGRPMSDAMTLAAAFKRAVEMPVISPGHSSPDGLPANDSDLERVDDELLEALALARGRVKVRDVAAALAHLDAEVRR